MSTYKFVKNPITGRWVINAPKRAHRTEHETGETSGCPFCPEGLQHHAVVHRHGDVNVIPNNFPFAPIHEVVIHSHDHEKNFELLSRENVENIFQVYLDRFNEHKEEGHVYIFHNRGHEAGESLTHPHSQIAVIPFDKPVASMPLGDPDNLIRKTSYFALYAPTYSQWPYEVTISPLERLGVFGELEGKELAELAQVVRALIKAYQVVFSAEISYNFYIYPGKDWYMRFIPRKKIIGGFELASEVFVNDADSAEVVSKVGENFQIED